MRAIDKFILHTVHNIFLINEYSEGEIKRLIDKFREEADDFNIDITDEQLKKYIERFDQIKNSPKITDKDLRQYSLSKLIKLVTTSKGAELAPEQFDITPDVVYDENGIIIYNGSKEGNCLNFGSNEKWCITRGSFGNYRYSTDQNRKNATFYLVRDTNVQVEPDDKSSSDFRKSFFVVVVGNDQTYKVSDRTNNDVGGTGTEWDRWENFSFVERHFPILRGLERIFKYIPLSTQEKSTQMYSRKPISIKDWVKFPYNIKEQYLVIRQGQSLFNDITNDAFIDRYIIKYPQIATFISVNTGIISNPTLIKHLDKFSNQNTKSIISNMRDKIDMDILSDEQTSFEAKKLVVKFDKIEIPSNAILYITEDGKTIVGLSFDDNISLSLYTEDDEYPNVKINKRTIKYLINCPEIDKIPFRNIIKLSVEGIIDKEVLDKFIVKLKENPDSNIIIKSTEDGNELIIEPAEFEAYKVTENGTTKIPYNNIEVQNVLRDEGGDNPDYQQAIINIFKLQRDTIPDTFDKEGLLNLVRAIPFNDRTWTLNNTNIEVLLTSDETPSFIMMPIATDDVSLRSNLSYGDDNNWKIRHELDLIRLSSWRAYFTFLRSTNRVFTSEKVVELMQGNANYRESKKEFIEANPPMIANSRYIPAYYNNHAYLIDRTNTRNSFMVSENRGGVIRANLSVEQANQMIAAAVPVPAVGQAQPTPVAAAAVPVPGDGAPRRGRPVGGGNPRPAQPVAPAIAHGEGIGLDDVLGGDINLVNGFNQLPNGARRRLIQFTGRRLPLENNRGASRRQNLLQDAGRVVDVVEFGPSSVYVIRLSPVRSIASIVIQPGNAHYVITSNGAL